MRSLTSAQSSTSGDKPSRRGRRHTPGCWSGPAPPIGGCGTPIGGSALRRTWLRSQPRGRSGPGSPGRISNR